MDDELTAGQAGITAPEVQAHLDSRISRIDEEMARAMSDYQDARGRLADQYGKMEGETGKQEKSLEGQRKPLEAAVLDGKKPPAGFTRKMADYQESLANLANSRLARRMAYPATEKPGEVPTGEPLGTAPAKSPTA